MSDPPASTSRQAFADNVRVAREKAGLTQEQLAWAAGLHQTEIARIEGGRRNPGLDTIFKVARGLGVPPGELFTGIAWSALARHGDISGTSSDAQLDRTEERSTRQDKLALAVQKARAGKLLDGDLDAVARGEVVGRVGQLPDEFGEGELDGM